MPLLTPINTDFSRSIGTLMGQASDDISGLGKVATDYLTRKTAEEDKAYQRGREKIQDDRATQLWNEQQKEKENLKLAGELHANQGAVNDAILAQDPRFNTAMDMATKAGMDTGTMGVKGVMDWYGSQQKDTPLNISSSVPNVGGTAGGPILKTVSKQVPVSVPATPSAPILTKPKVIATGDAATPRTDNTEWNVREPNTFGKVVTMAKELHSPTALLGVIGNVLDPTKIKLPSLSNQRELNLSGTAAPAQAKADKILAPQTSKQQETSKTQMKTVLEKVVVGHNSGTPPKLNQIEGAVIDKIFGSIDPNAQSRESAKGMVEGLYYSLGLNPKQVKEYSEGTVESVYGDKNDPIKLALANAKVGGYEKNVHVTNELGMKIMSENRADARQALQLAASERQHKETLLSRKEEAKAQKDALAEYAKKKFFDAGMPKDLSPAEESNWINAFQARQFNKGALDYNTAEYNAKKVKYEEEPDKSWNPAYRLFNSPSDMKL